ncbi:hypothetical protein BC941DRAFT_500411 [Chlamydoabsidia padenii]|nr:hypothetical protein BC941DRAFT_500411 [Chlamydoabsidia padenii]
MSYFYLTSANLWNVDDALKWAEENTDGVDNMPPVKLVSEANWLMDSNKAEAAKQFLAKLQDLLKVHSHLPSSGNVINNSIVGDQNTVIVINEAEPFASDLSPIPSRNKDADSEDSDDEDNGLHNSFIGDENHPRRTNIHYYHNIEKWPDKPSTGSTNDLGEGHDRHDDLRSKATEEKGTSSSEHFDFVKLGLGMREYSVKTFTMDMKGSIYRMVQLDSCDMISQQSGLGAFSMVFRCFLQVKNLAGMVAHKLKDAQLVSATGKRKLNQSIWRSK